MIYYSHSNITPGHEVLKLKWSRVPLLHVSCMYRTLVLYLEADLQLNHLLQVVPCPSEFNPSLSIAGVYNCRLLKTYDCCIFLAAKTMWASDWSMCDMWHKTQPTTSGFLFKNNTGARQYTRAVLSIFAEIHSTHPISSYFFLLSPTLGLPTLFIDTLFGVHITGISGWKLWCVTHHNTRVWLRSLHWVSFCSQSCLHVPLRKALHKIMKYMSSMGIIRNFGSLRTILWNGFNRLSRLSFTGDRDSSLVPITRPSHLQAEAVVPI